MWTGGKNHPLPKLLINRLNMQNMDFYDGRHLRSMPPQFDKSDPEYFARTTRALDRENDTNHNRAVRMLTLITALIIIAFTTGLVVGIKFAGGAERSIVDEKTYNTMNSISSKMSGLVKEISGENRQANTLYPKDEFPFVIQLGKEYSETDTKNVAQFLSSKGHTVIVSKSRDNFRIFTGPYKTENEARKTLTEISLYRQYAISANAQIIKRI